MNDEAKLAAVFPVLAESDLPIGELDIEVAARNSLLRSGIHTVAQLLQLTHTELVGLFPNRGLPFYSEIISRLACLAQPPKTGETSRTYTVKSLSDGILGESKVKRFNIFQVAGIWKSEEIHTRIIAELLNPNSKFHEMGTAFLQKLLDRLGLKEDLSLKESIKVETEVHTVGEGKENEKCKNRRIDMTIETRHYYLPFEVKIWAGDQESQLYDYYQYACSYAEQHGKNRPPCIYYLTPDGHAPSVWSIKSSTGDGGLDNKDFCQLSFRETVLLWLDDCMNDTDKQISADVLEIMRQLRDNIDANFLLGEDILDAVQQELSCYHIEWTECTDKYRTFTLKKEGNWEVALRIQKYYSKVKLSVICGHVEDTDDGPQISYAGNREREQIQHLLEDAFTSPRDYLKLDVDAAWDWFRQSPTASKGDFMKTFKTCVFGRLEKSVQAQLYRESCEA